MSKKHRSDSYSHILKYTGLFGGVQGIIILVGVIRNKLVASILGPNGMGLISLFNSTIKMLSDGVNLGVPTSAVKSISEEYDNSDKEKIEHTVTVVRSWTYLLAFLGTVLCIVLSPLLSWFTFSWNGHTLHFLCLSPVIGLTIIAGGETAILKGMRQLGHLATISIYSVIAALIISVPIYYFFGDAGIVPSLVLMALAQMLLTVRYSYKLFPLRFKLQRNILHEGLPMVKLGIAFGVALLFASLSDFFIRSYLNNAAGIDTVGLYNAGIMMAMVYVSMVFSAMETDYFPRLSGVNHLGVTFNTTVNRQIEVMVLLTSPMLVAFLLALPLLLPLLYSGRFMPALPMTQIVVLAMYFRALKMPVEYIPLAKGDSRTYLIFEGIDALLMFVFVVLFFNRFGLKGAGFAILLSAMIDFILVYIYYRKRYDYRPTASVFLYASIQLPLGLLTYAVTYITSPLLYWGLGIALLFVSSMVSIAILRTKTHLWNSLTAKIKGLFNHNH